MRRLCFAIFHLCAVIVTTTNVSAQTARSYLTADSITVGDRFALVVVAEIPSDGTAYFGQLDNLGDLVAVGNPVRGSARIDGILTDSIIIPVTTFAIDTLTVPPLPVALRSGDDSTVVFTDGLIRTVTSLVPADAQDIIDITEIEPFPRRIWPWLLALLALATGFLLYRRFAGRPKPIVIEIPPEPELEPPTPLEEARARLVRLRDFELATPEDTKEFFVELSETVRTYVERELRIPALETTTGELAILARRSPELSTDSIEALENQLQFADMVKFSDVRPPSTRSFEALEVTGEWIENIAASVARRRRPAETESAEGVLVSTAQSGNGQVGST